MVKRLLKHAGERVRQVIRLRRVGKLAQQDLGRILLRDLAAKVFDHGLAGFGQAFCAERLRVSRQSSLERAAGGQLSEGFRDTFLG